MNVPVQITVTCCQLAPDVEHPDAGAELTRAAVAGAVAAGAQVIVLPELAHSGYVFCSDEEARAAAVTADGDLLAAWAREVAPAGAIVIGGFCELGTDGAVYNSAALVDGRGVQAVYRKLHLWGEEPRWFQPGRARAPVVTTRYGRIGLGVCYDLEFPELARGLALGGAQLIALPTNWPREPAQPRPGGLAMLTVLASATAYQNRVYVAVCDRGGRERGLSFEGGSVVAAPDGTLLARAGGSGAAPASVSAACELLRADDKRSGEHNDAFADRRPDQYG